ncbi:MAG: VOC family protein [Pseudomonadota bacterium]
MGHGFRLGRLDHMHLVVPDREAAATWYEQTLGFERVEAYKHWWGIPGCPIHISADGGASSLALFQEGEGHQATNGIGMGVGFVVPGSEFKSFAGALGHSVQVTGKSGQLLTVADVVDLDLCFSYGFMDPYGHELELSTYDHDEVKQYLQGEGVEAIRYW